ncbi:MAG: NUDIX domain-containing protein [Chloroflexaceae bacterium]|nr:NUDIX domain-containing protein [Chloroflexaceae bacterium]NJO06468.1 NUDIX domain-containing protein [Chloroflexaceae bacterium]
MAPHGSKSTAPQRTSYSAGGVIYRVNERGQVEVALIATDGGKRWGLPKGHVRRGERAEAAAVREVAEETGLIGEVVQHLATIEYWFRAGASRVHKYVDLFLICYVQGDLIPQESEVDDARWFTLDDALDISSFKRERDVLSQVRVLWETNGFL